MLAVATRVPATHISLLSQGLLWAIARSIQASNPEFTERSSPIRSFFKGDDLVEEAFPSGRFRKPPCSPELPFT